MSDVLPAVRDLDRMDDRSGLLAVRPSCGPGFKDRICLVSTRGPVSLPQMALLLCHHLDLSPGRGMPALCRLLLRLSMVLFETQVRPGLPHPDLLLDPDAILIRIPSPGIPCRVRNEDDPIVVQANGKPADSVS